MSLIDALLDITKLESGKTDYEFNSHNLLHIVERCIQEISGLLSDKNQFIDLSGDKDLDAEMDEKLITQVVINLISNAIKFSPANSKISIHLFPTKDESTRNRFVSHLKLSNG